MATSTPFIDPETGGLDTDQLRSEAYPLPSTKWLGLVPARITSWREG